MAQQRAFASAIAAKQRNSLAAADPQRDPAQRFDAAGVAETYVVDLDDRRLVVRGPWSVVRCSCSPATDNGPSTTGFSRSPATRSASVTGSGRSAGQSP